MSEVEHPSSDAPRPRRSEGQLNRRRIDEHEDLYQVVYEESQRALDDQKDELNVLRDRSVQFVIFIGAATAFLVGTGLQSLHRSTSFFILAGIASAVSLTTIGYLFAILNPATKTKWAYRLSSDYLIADWIEKEVPRPSRAEFIRDLAVMNDDSQRENEKLLSPLRKRYRLLIALGALQVIFWAALVWWKG